MNIPAGSQALELEGHIELPSKRRPSHLGGGFREKMINKKVCSVQESGGGFPCFHPSHEAFQGRKGKAPKRKHQGAHTRTAN